jgi:hypothetical protein
MFRPALVMLLLCAALVSTGCVRRRLTVRSIPAGASVYVDDQPIGQTPVSTPFTYYGTRKIQLVKDNFETLSVKQRFNPPWYEYPVIEFFSENLWPWEIRDERMLDFQLIPQVIVPTERLLENGQQLRDAAGQGAIAPLLTPGEKGVVPPAGALPPPVESRYPLPEQEQPRPPGRVIGER